MKLTRFPLSLLKRIKKPLPQKHLKKFLLLLFSILFISIFSLRAVAEEVSQPVSGGGEFTVECSALGASASASWAFITPFPTVSYNILLRFQSSGRSRVFPPTPGGGGVFAASGNFSSPQRESAVRASGTIVVFNGRANLITTINRTARCTSFRR